MCDETTPFWIAERLLVCLLASCEKGPFLNLKKYLQVLRNKGPNQATTKKRIAIYNQYQVSKAISLPGIYVVAHYQHY